MLISPLDHEDVVARLTQSVLDDVLEVAHVYDVELLTRHAWTADTNYQHVVTCIPATLYTRLNNHNNNNVMSYNMCNI